MPSDASIYDNIKPVQIETPQQYQLNQNATQLALADQQQKLQAARETGVARSVLARLGNEPNAALSELRRVAPTYAVGYEKQLNESRKAGIENKKLENDVHKGRMDYALQMLDVADAQRDTDPQRAEAAYQLFRHNAAMDDEDAQALPPTLPSAEIVGHMKQLGMTAKEQMDQRDKALTHYANGDPQRGFASSLLSAATDPESWKEAQQAAIQMGVPRSLVASFGDAPTPEALARAKDLSLTQAEREAIRRDDLNAANQTIDNQRQAAAQAETVRHNLAMEKRPVAGAAGAPAGSADVVETVKGMKDGTLPPVMPGRGSKEYTALMAESHRQGFDLAAAATDWAATQKHVATLNGAQQTRLNQAVNQLPELLDSVDDLAKQWKAGRFPPLNKAQLTLAKNGAFGRQAATIATQLDAQIADVNADLATVYMGGNSPTDRGLDLASKALNSNWDEKVLTDAVSRARQNVRIRQNSIRNTGVQGASPNNPYAPQQAAPAAKPTLRFNPATGKVEPLQ